MISFLDTMAMCVRSGGGAQFFLTTTIILKQFGHDYMVLTNFTTRF